MSNFAETEERQFNNPTLRDCYHRGWTHAGYGWGCNPHLESVNKAWHDAYVQGFNDQLNGVKYQGMSYPHN